MNLKSDPIAGAYYSRKELPDGRVAWTLPMIFTTRIAIGWPDVNYIDDVWCYDTPRLAIHALEEWDGTGEPEGWHRHPLTGRRRPNGDATQEYVRE